MPRGRSWRDRAIWLCLLVGALGVPAGCATAPPGGGASSRDLRTGGARSGQADGDGTAGGRFTDWKGVVESLAGLGGSTCRGLSQQREDHALALVFPATCLFPDGGTQVRAASRPAVEAIARELKSTSDREFWIAARDPQTTDGHSSRDRATALVNALVSFGVPPNRLAAILGTPDRPPPPALAAAATIEIVAAPSLP